MCILYDMLRVFFECLLCFAVYDYCIETYANTQKHTRTSNVGNCLGPIFQQLSAALAYLATATIAKSNNNSRQCKQSDAHIACCVVYKFVSTRTE